MLRPIQPRGIAVEGMPAERLADRLRDANTLLRRGARVAHDDVQKRVVVLVILRLGTREQPH